jgi:hypothetical protein
VNASFSLEYRVFIFSFVTFVANWDEYLDLKL